jgi:RNA polymerase sigma-70 factor (ECF subfamily)
MNWTMQRERDRDPGVTGFFDLRALVTFGGVRRCPDVEDRVAATAPDASDPERGWVEALRRGDDAGFDAVFAAYRTRIYRYLIRMTGRRDLAEDLTQDVFLRLAKAARSLRPDTRLRAWLFTVAHNVVVSHARAAKVIATLAGELADEPAASPTTPFEAVAQTANQLKLERALATIAPLYREVVLLVAVEGLGAADAGDALGISAEAVRQRLSRARAMLAKEMS